MGTDRNAQLAARIDEAATAASFSGSVRLDLDGVTVQRGYGLADRAHEVANDPASTMYATASGTKGFTALTIMRLVERNELSLDTTVRSVLGDELPLIDDRVTVEHLLTHRSGIGDYLDESVVVDWTDYVMTVPVHELATTEQFLRVLDGHPMRHEPGTQFEYCNGAFVVLALIAERVTGQSFHDLVDELVCRPAGLVDTAFLRSDELPGRAARGYLHAEGLRTNVFHLPVRGNGDGGIYTTAADMAALWAALFAGRVVSPTTWAAMTRPTTVGADDDLSYGLGLWLYPSGAVSVHGFDAGVGFVSVRDPGGRFTYTVLGNTTRGTWPVSQALGTMVS